MWVCPVDKSSRIVTLISRVNTTTPPHHHNPTALNYHSKVQIIPPPLSDREQSQDFFLQISANISPLISSVKELEVWLLLIARFYHREDHNLWGFKFLLDLMGTLRHEEGKLRSRSRPGKSPQTDTDYRTPPGSPELFSWRSSPCRWSGRRWCNRRGWWWGWWGGWRKDSLISPR